MRWLGPLRGRPTGLVWALTWTSLIACSESAPLRFEILRSVNQLLDPAAGGMSRLRLQVAGEEAGASVIVEGPADAATLEVEAFEEDRFRASLFGFDEEGNVVAFGRLGERRAGSTEEGSAQPVSIELRRNLAFVIHQDDPLPGEPGRLVYAIDVVRRTVAGRFQIGQPGSVARGISAWGGRALLIAEQRGSQGFAGVLSGDDLSYRNIALDHVPDIVVAPAEGRVGVAAGGGSISFVDFEDGTIVDDPISVGGRVLDAAVDEDGRRALLVIDISPPGLVSVDLRRRQAESLTLLPDAAGVAVDVDSGVAYVTSSQNAQVAALDLASGRSVQLQGRLGGPGGLVSWSAALDGIVTVSEEGPRSTLYGYSAFAQAGLPGSLPGFDDVAGVVMDGSGRHGLVVAGGEAGGESGLTLLRARFGELPEASNTLYPEDPVEGVRYRPRGAAILHGD